MAKYSPNKAESEAAQGLADLKEYCISEPISIPKPSSACSTSSMSGMATPTSIDNIESTNLNHQNNEEVSVEENRLLFSKFKISGTSPFVDCQQLQPINQVLANVPPADPSLSTLAPILQNQELKNSIPIQHRPVNSHNNILTMEPPQRASLLNEEDYQRRMNVLQHQRANYEANQRKLRQQQLHRQYCIQQQLHCQHQLLCQHAQCVNSQCHAQFLGSYPPVQRSKSVIAYPVNQNQQKTQIVHNRRRQTLPTLNSILHVPQNISMYPPHHQQQQQEQLQSNHGPLMPIQSTSFQQAMVHERASVRQQRDQTEEQEFDPCDDMSGPLTRCDGDDVSTSPTTVAKNESPEADTEDMDEDYDDNNDNDKEYANTIRNKRKLPAKGGREKPRWTVDMRKKLFRVVTTQKKLADMATFDWDAIGRQVGRPGKACKDQWRRALLPKLEQSFETYSQYSPSEESKTL